ncbi:MarR family winged helix-turn-helix transcriptional regulator [Streptomyces sp. UNOC14_S4]|uniref:MarR family winged helix-turn-helix transcriptional regulator n=1 Tax=Streptomyces sp. UNOC14_S4 TaxID=2872340 RepID=UPI001E2A05C7|nr:MarR family transcriptional regulator [Streptomyces sp. UNOC14_S4]MCC3768936.1 MarR family transcriptional regulator [Streptomyces sp. UNOC14_S4]
MPHPHTPRKPTPDEFRVVGLVPLLEPYFRGPVVHGLMPEPLRDVMESNGLTARHGAVLPQLLAGEPLTVSEIARRLHVSLPTASELVGALSRAGVVERTEDPANRRRTLVSLADTYRPHLEAFVARRGEHLLRALDTLSPAERAGFVAGLTAWVREVQG